MKKTIYHLSIRSYYPDGTYTQHRRDMPLREVPKWIEAYAYTHPDCQSITVKIWLTDEGGTEE